MPQLGDRTCCQRSEAVISQLSVTSWAVREWTEYGWVYVEAVQGLVLALHDSSRDELGRAVMLGGRSATP